MILSNSRYNESISELNGVAVKTAMPKESTTKIKVMTISTKQGETFQSLSGKFLNDSTQFWKIAKLNNHIEFPDVIPANSTIYIPII